MADENYFSWEAFDDLSRFVILELKKCGYQLISSNWEPGEMAWDTLRIVRNNTEYLMFLSCRKGNTFGIGMCELSSLKSLFNKTLTYNTTGKEAILEALSNNWEYDSSKVFH